MENIDDVDYRHGNNVFKRFKLKNLGEYHDLYVQSDTLLLADVFENFRNTCIKVYEPDPAHFLSLPGLAWQACLKKTNIKLELLTDYESSYIQYLDANNLCGWAMSQKLLVNGFKWVNDVTEINEEFIKNYDENNDI